MDSGKIKHLEMIQEVINRMARNSFTLKGWAVTLLSAMFALASKEANLFFFFLAYVPVVTFWFLDAYYLHQERLFRHLYNDVRTRNNDKIDFSMDTSIFGAEDFSVENCERGKNKCCKNTGYKEAFWSSTEYLFYIPLIAVITIVAVFASTRGLFAR